MSRHPAPGTGQRKLPNQVACRLLIGAAGLAAALGLAAWCVLSLPQFGGTPAGARLERMRANPLFRDGRFANPVPPASYSLDFAWKMLEGQFGSETRTPPGRIPVVAVAPALSRSPPAPNLRAFWIGHASVYVELDGVRMLFDPVFSEYASPFPPFGPKRFAPPPIALSALPKIDAVLITHDHYDHLDMPTVRHFAALGSEFFVPLGIGAHLERWGVPPASIHELEWWEERALKGLRIVATPARHYSGRGLTRNGTLWTSWAVIGARHRFYVSGDSGYSDHFRTIGQQLGPFDLAFVKIGAYGPGSPWLDIHMSAEDAVRAHQDLRARRLFPVHWGTFNLAFHDWDEPIKRALAAARKNNVEVLTPRIGEMVDADGPLGGSPWWETVR